MEYRASSYEQWGDGIISGTEHNMKFKIQYVNLSDTNKHYHHALVIIGL